MGYRRFEDVLVHDMLTHEAGPLYECNDEDIWYLGLAGELASEIKRDKVLLPMLSQDNHANQIALEKALLEAASLRPLRTVANFKEAVWDFSTQTANIDLEPSVGSWFGDEETVKALKSSVQYKPDGHYKSGLHYDADRRGVSINMKKAPKGSIIQSKTIIIVPKPEYFGVLSKTDKFFNFLFFPNQIFRYHLKNLEIGDGHNPASEG